MGHKLLSIKGKDRKESFRFIYGESIVQIKDILCAVINVSCII